MLQGREAANRLGEIWQACAAEPGPLAWLDAGPQAKTGRSYLIVPSDQVEILRYSRARGRAEYHRAGQLIDAEGSIWPLLRRYVAAPPAGRLTKRGNQPEFHGGWVGWLGYACGFEPLGLSDPGGSAAGTEEDDAAWFRAGAWLCLDHASQRLTLHGGGAAQQRLKDLVKNLPGERANSWRVEGATNPSVTLFAQPGGSLAGSTVSARWRTTDPDYANAVRRAQEFIAAGEAFQICLTSQVHGTEPLNAIACYAALREASPSHHGFYLRIGATELASSTPETFLAATPDGRIWSRPIKGTRSRGASAVDDAEQRAELASNAKEHAENVMIVDLMRNDLGRVAELGSVAVDELFGIESYAHVHQLVSTVSARLSSGLNVLDAVYAAFPAGSMTGAPKRRAVELLSSLESGPRGIYSGIAGYLGNDGGCDLAMIIRTLVTGQNGWYVGAGGGITALSEPDAELAEAKLKAAALLAAIGASPGESR